MREGNGQNDLLLWEGTVGYRVQALLGDADVPAADRPEVPVLDEFHHTELLWITHAMY